MRNPRRSLAQCAALMSVLAFSNVVPAKGLIVSGVATFVDGKPIPIGTVYVQSLRRRLNAMPETRLLGLGTTSLNGDFEIEVENVRGDVYVKLIDDHCSWLGGYAMVWENERKSRNAIRVEIQSERDVCETAP